MNMVGYLATEPEPLGQRNPRLLTYDVVIGDHLRCIGRPSPIFSSEGRSHEGAGPGWSHYGVGGRHGIRCRHAPRAMPVYQTEAIVLVEDRAERGSAVALPHSLR